MSLKLLPPTYDIFRRSEVINAANIRNIEKKTNKTPTMKNQRSAQNGEKRRVRTKKKGRRNHPRNRKRWKLKRIRRTWTIWKLSSAMTFQLRPGKGEGMSHYDRLLLLLRCTVKTR